MSGTIRRQFKVCLIGDGYVGKTSIRRTYLKEGFKRSYIPTLGVDFAQKSIFFEGSPTNLVIWDIAGQVAFQNLRRRYYEGSSGIILLYAVDDRKSFDSASKWLVEAHGFMKELPPIMIVANKIDLRHTLRQEDMVTTEEGQAFADSVAQKLGAKAVFIETSAKQDKNVDETFEKLTRMMIGAADQTLASFPVSHEMRASEPESTTPASTEPTSTTSTSTEPTSTTPISTESTSTTSTSTEPTSPTPQTSFTPKPAEEPAAREIDPVTLLPTDSEHLEEESIGLAMTELQNLRSELKIAEEELAQTLSKLETDLLTLKNTVHVKRIMFEHLKQQLKTTREEWAKAYEEHQAIEKKRKEEFATRNIQIAAIRMKIDEVGARIRSRVGDLDMRKMSE